MGDRFYQQQIDLTGTCPGHKGRKKKMAWTDEQKAKVIAAYVAAGPTPENSMEIVAEIAEEEGQSPNGVLMILSKAGVYIKKSSAKKATSDKPATVRVSKEASAAALTAAIEEAGGVVDAEIIGRLTGKACIYFTNVLKGVPSVED